MRTIGLKFILILGFMGFLMTIKSYGYFDYRGPSSLFCASMHLVPFNESGFMVGDIIFQPMDNRVARLIEEEEDSFFSHVGIVLEVGYEIKVAEAYGSAGVSLIPLRTFLKKNDPLRPAVVARHIDWRVINENKEDLLERFKDEFKGKGYNYKFDWDSTDSFYCSQMITLLLNPYISDKNKIKTKKMHFSKYPDKWREILGGEPPIGKEGNSPGDFDHDPNFLKLGCL